MEPLPFKHMPHILVYDRGAAVSLESIAKQICDRTFSDHCSIFLVQDPKTILLCATTSPRLIEGVGTAAYQTGEGLTGSVFERVTTINVNLQSADQKRIIAPDLRWRSKHNEGPQFTGWMGAPVSHRDNLLGVVRIMRVNKTFGEAEK
jgi:signal transduction protein with GAF and PtsI domain